MWKYDSTSTSHINHIYQLTSMINFGKIIHKVEQRSKKMRSTNFFLDLKGFETSYIACIEEDNIVGERQRREPEDEA